MRSQLIPNVEVGAILKSVYEFGPGLTHVYMDVYEVADTSVSPRRTVRKGAMSFPD